MATVWEGVVNASRAMLCLQTKKQYMTLDKFLSWNIKTSEQKLNRSADQAIGGAGIK